MTVLDDDDDDDDVGDGDDEEEVDAVNGNDCGKKKNVMMMATAMKIIPTAY